MAVEVFEPRALPGGLGAQLRRRLEAAHRARPFSTVDARGTLRRVRAVVDSFGVESTIYRGGLDLRGTEVDHVWLGVPTPGHSPVVLDLAYPLFADEFVATLRYFVAGDVEPAQLEAAADGTGVDERVVGIFPAMVRYLGQPVWSARTN